MAVLADSLTQAGDPRGELIVLQLTLERAPDDRRLLKATDKHLARHSQRLLGSLGTAGRMCELTWKRGFIVQARLTQHARVDGAWGGVQPSNMAQLPRITRALVQHPSAAQTLLQLELRAHEGPFGSAQLLDAVWATRDSGSLTVLSVHHLSALGVPDDRQPSADATVNGRFVSVDELLLPLVLARLRGG